MFIWVVIWPLLSSVWSIAERKYIGDLNSLNIHFMYLDYIALQWIWFSDLIEFGVLCSHLYSFRLFYLLCSRNMPLWLGGLEEYSTHTLHSITLMIGLIIKEIRDTHYLKNYGWYKSVIFFWLLYCRGTLFQLNFKVQHLTLNFSKFAVGWSSKC